MTAFDEQIKFLETQIAETEKLITETTAKIEQNEKELKKQQIFLGEYLASLYEVDQMSLLEQIIKARSFSDFIDRREYLETMRGKIKGTVDNISKIRRELKQDKQKLDETSAQQKTAREALALQKAEKELTLTQVMDEERIIRRKFGERLSKSGISPYCKGEGREITAKYPVFSFPVKCGYISQGFGMTEFASLDKAYNGAIHNGFDVGVGTGTEIRAAGNGTVYAKGASPSGGWGNWVMIKHDKVKIDNNEVEFYSLYAHLVSETYLNIDEKVTPDTIVGWVGGTPYWAPHLHFSLFLSNSAWGPGTIGPYPGNAVDPLDYMNIPISISGSDWDPKYAHF